MQAAYLKTTKQVKGVTNRKLRALAVAIAHLPQTKIKTVNRFGPDVYLREITIPAGTFVIGKEHRTEHWNVMLSGKMRLLIDGRLSEVEAPFVVKSKPGSIKVALAETETRWMTIHPTKEKNLKRLERLLTVPITKQLD